MKPIKFPMVVKVGNVSVSIYRTRSKVGYCSYQVADYREGKRRLRTFSDLDKAKEWANTVACGLASGEVAALDMRSTDRASYGRAIELLRGTQTPLELAAARYAEAVRILGDGAKLPEAVRFYLAKNPGALPSKPVAAVVAELIATKEGRRKSPRYIADLRIRLKRFAETFKVGIGDITTAKVQDWLDGLKVAPQTYKNYRTVLNTLFAYAEARGYLVKGSNPVEGVEVVEAGEGEVAVYTPIEFTALLKAASPDFLPCLCIGGFAGLRSAEIERLEWSDIDLQGRFIKVSAAKAKTASRRIVPICEALSAWLSQYDGKTGNIWKGTHDHFYDAQQATGRGAGVKWKQNALRHSYASYRLAETGDDARVAQELGNSRSVVHRHYKALAKPQESKDWFAIMPVRPVNVVSIKAA